MNIVSTIRDWVSSILGAYEPIEYTVKTLVADPINGGAISQQYTVVANGVAGVDWEYIVTAALLLVTIYSVFRLLGVLLQAVSGVGR